MKSEQDNEFKLLLETMLPSFGLDTLTERQIDQLVKHYSMLRTWNHRINLTRIVKPEVAARLHYAESLFGGRFINDARTILDVGTGAGFPAIPLAVLKPAVQITALEVNQKKAIFLREVKDALRLDNFSVRRARLDEFDWTDYDLLTSRALDQAEKVLPSVIDSLSVRQRLVLFCGADLLANLDLQLGKPYALETHPIPLADARLIAIFSRAE